MSYSYFDKRAGALQDLVRGRELDRRDTFETLEEYDELGVRVAAVHTRQDLVLVVSHVSSINEQLATVRRLLWVIAALLLYSVAS